MPSLQGIDTRPHEIANEKHGRAAELRHRDADDRIFNIGFEFFPDVVFELLNGDSRRLHHSDERQRDRAVFLDTEGLLVDFVGIGRMNQDLIAYGQLIGGSERLGASG